LAFREGVGERPGQGMGGGGGSQPKGGKAGLFPFGKGALGGKEKGGPLFFWGGGGDGLSKGGFFFWGKNRPKGKSGGGRFAFFLKVFFRGRG